ncbi:CBO0543 family protein [Virgibacillus sp. W0181]|uniref:CBO0543 family protein n=1 Tax=Virgibacillus sp. W0181 TaxID=3391581 RepID=UPI003F46C5BB
MKSQQFELLKVIRGEAEKLSEYQIEYWQSFSSITTWQFWALVLILILPLIVLFIIIDKSKILLLGFFGLNYHVWFSYTNSIGVGLGLWEYPYHLIPSLPSFSLDASLVPISFMLLYQWTLHHKKNIYLYSLFLSAIFAFILKPLLVNFHFFHMFSGVNYFHLFLFYMIFFIVSKLVTTLFVWLQKKKNK